MAWSAPMTAVSGTAFTAAQFNQYVRDNLLETAPAKATAAGQIFVSTAANAIAARTPTQSAVDTGESTSSTTAADLTTPGPAVTVTTGTQALVFVYCRSVSSLSASYAAFMGYAISGATTQAATVGLTLSNTDTNSRAYSAVFLQTLTAGSNTFTAKYWTGGSGTCTFTWRKLLVIPL